MTVDAAATGPGRAGRRTRIASPISAYIGRVAVLDLVATASFFRHLYICRSIVFFFAYYTCVALVHAAVAEAALRGAPCSPLPLSSLDGQPAAGGRVALEDSGGRRGIQVASIDGRRAHIRP